jgi:hypothetical protein
MRPDSATPAAATDAAAKFARLVGTVYDSVHLAPLAGAAVFLEGSSRPGLTNDRGGFALDSIPAGVYRLRVEHVLLDSIGVAMVTDTFRLADDETRTLALSVPASETLVALSCPARTRVLGPSAIIGRLLDADTNQPVDSASVSFAWSELVLRTMRREPRVRGVRTGADGMFRICGVPNQVEGTLQASKGRITTAEVRVTFQGEPLMIQGLRIGNTATVASATDSAAIARAAEQATGPRFSAVNVQKGEAVLTGRVVGANGQPIVNARVEVEGTVSRVLTRENGEFTLTELPSGTQKVVARQLGYEPVEKPVELSARTPATVTIVMSKPAQVLATVRVEAEQDRGLERLGFNQRKRAMSGTFLTGDDVMKRGPNMLTDVFRTVPGLRVVPAGMNEYKVENARSTGLGANCVKFILDGASFEAVFPGDVDRMIPPYNVAAIEVYQGSATPIQFQVAGASACATVVIWSKYRAEQGNRQRR